MMRKIVLIAGVVLGIGAGLHAATVTYDVLFTGQGTVRDITVAPGATVDITVTAKVDPADPNNPDTDGLALVNLDLSISFGIPQEALTLDPDFQSAFPLFASGGTPASNGGISSIGGAQNTFNPASIKRGKGLGTPMVIATGTLQTPSTPGTYTITTNNLGANVLDPAPATTVTRAATIIDNSLTVRIVASGGGGGTPTNHPPVALFSAVADANDPLTIHFDASGSSDPDGDTLTYAWTFGDGQSGSGKTAAHKYAAAASYTVVLTVSDGRGETATKSASVTVTTTPPTNKPPTAVLTASPVSGSAPLAVSFDSTGSSDPDGDPLTFTWDFGDSQSASGPTASHTYSAANTYTAILTVADGRGGTDAKSVTITVATASDGGSNPPPDDGNNPPPNNGDNNPPPPVVAPMCGAGMVETTMMCTLGLFALQWTRRRD